MTDIKEIAATYATRIFDRMEMCRGSAILKSDIEREVEMALNEALPSVQVHHSEGQRRRWPTTVMCVDGLNGTPYPGWRFREEGGVLHHEPETISEEQEAIRQAIVEDALRRLDHAE
jgi:hypothetical protein